MFIFSGIYHFDEIMDHLDMTISDIRRTTARILAERVGGQAEFARKTLMSDSQISQLLGENPAKNIGNKIARRIEVAFEKPTGWLDSVRQETDFSDVHPPQPKLTAVQPTTPERPPPPPFYIDPVEVEIINAFRQASTMGKISIRAAAAAALQQSTLNVSNQS